MTPSLKEEMVEDVAEKLVTSQNQVAEVYSPSINLDETSSHDIMKEMMGDVTDYCRYRKCLRST